MRCKRSIAGGVSAMRRMTLLTVVLAVTGLVGQSCHDEKDPSTSIPPIFSVTPVDLSGAYDPSDSTLGDIKFIPPVIVPFGAVLDQYHLSPAIEYYTRPEAPVRAVAAGLIEAVTANPPEQGDYEIRVTCSPGSDYTVIYDHLLDVVVQAGIRVAPGDTLGTAGTWSDKLRRTELQVNLGDGNNTRSYCPLNYGDSSFMDGHRRLLREYTARIVTPAYDTLCLSGPVIP